MMVAAKRLGLVDSGQFVFISVDNRPSLDNFNPWLDKVATEQENNEALEAFQVGAFFSWFFVVFLLLSETYPRRLF